MEEPSSSTAQAVGLLAVVKELQALTTLDLHKLLRDSENFTIHHLTKKGLFLKVDMEKLAGSLPLHLIAVLMSSDRDEDMFTYLLCGIRLLHSLCDLASRNSKLEQIFLDDVKVLEQLMDFVFYMLIVLAGYRQEDHAFSRIHLVHSTLVACNLYLLPGFLTTKWEDIVQALLAHPKVDTFMDAAFGSVRMVVRCLEITLLAYYKDLSMESNLTAERVVYYLCQQCEASLQFLQSLCQQKLFKERLVKNKELCRKGGLLFLAQSILKLQIQLSISTRIKASISRLKSKILSILLSLCEGESIFLDEVASSAQSLDLAKSVALEVFDLLKTAFGRDPGHLTVDRSHPMGFVQLNAMRLADILSDDSNFRSYFMLCFTKVLTAIISLPQGEFLSCWCSSNLPDIEEDTSLEYDIFAAVGWVLDNTSVDVRNATNLEFNRLSNNMPRASYAHNKTSLFVKFFANLHCFVPNICEEQEKNLFVLKVLECLQMDLSNVLPGFSFAYDAPIASNATKNLRSLLSHAESLIPNFLSKEDVQLLRLFFGKLQSLLTSTGSGEDRAQDSRFEQSLPWNKFAQLNINEHNQEAQSAGGFPSPLTGKEPVGLNEKGGNLMEGMSENAAFPDIDTHNTRAGDTNQGNDLNGQDQVVDISAFGKTASGGAVEMDKDALNIETSGSDTSSAKGKNAIEHMDKGELSKSKEHFKRAEVDENPEDEKVETVQRRKRKRNIMNDKQVTLIEAALLDEPDMHRNAVSLQSWADKLSLHGSEVTPSQLKNWLNNRKARLARSARDVRTAAGAADVGTAAAAADVGTAAAAADVGTAAVAADVDTPVPDKQKEPVLESCDSPDSPGFTNIASLGFSPCKAGQYVVLVDIQGDEIGKGKVFQAHGKWYGTSLEESATCVVDVSELTVDKGRWLPYPSEAAGTTFADAETKLGAMRVLWDSNRVFRLRSE